MPGRAERAALAAGHLCGHQLFWYTPGAQTNEHTRFTAPGAKRPTFFVTGLACAFRYSWT